MLAPRTGTLDTVCAAGLIWLGLGVVCIWTCGIVAASL